MITTGSPKSSAAKTEIIDIASGGVTCSDLENFPVVIDAGVGGNLLGTPVVCGGNSSTYSVDAVGSWQMILPMPNLERAY